MDFSRILNAYIRNNEITLFAIYLGP